MKKYLSQQLCEMLSVNSETFISIMAP